MSNLPNKARSDTVRILACADLHLGRKIFVPEVIENSFLAPLSPEGAWEALVDLAIDPANEVDALVIAGDILDHEDDVLEAPFFFEQGLKRLQKENKPVILIAGNHDWRFLKIRHGLLGFAGVRILGADGRWESCEIELKGQTVRFEGWSFPAGQSPQNPLDSLPPLAMGGAVTIGLLHGDWQSANSPYAPFSIQQLISSRRDAWILGHIHIPKRLCEKPLIISPGSLQGLDSSEQGERGAWRIDIDASGHFQAEMIPLARLRFETADLDVTGLKEEEYIATLQKKLENSVRDSVRCLSLEVIWKGEVESLQKKEALQNLEGTYFHLKTPQGFVDCHIRKSTLEVRSPSEIEKIAGQDSIAGIMAKQLLELENEQEIRRVRELFEKEACVYPHLALEFDAKQLQFQAKEALFELLAQKEDG